MQGKRAIRDMLCIARRFHGTRPQPCSVQHMHGLTGDSQARAVGCAPVDTITAGYWPVPFGTDTLSSGEAASRYGKSVVLAGSPYSLTHAWPARRPHVCCLLHTGHQMPLHTEHQMPLHTEHQMPLHPEHQMHRTTLMRSCRPGTYVCALVKSGLRTYGEEWVAQQVHHGTVRDDGGKHAGVLRIAQSVSLSQPLAHTLLLQSPNRCSDGRRQIEGGIRECNDISLENGLWWWRQTWLTSAPMSKPWLSLPCIAQFLVPLKTASVETTSSHC